MQGAILAAKHTPTHAHTDTCSRNQDTVKLHQSAVGAHAAYPLSYCVQVTLDFKLALPQVAVVGSQSSGKSSVLEALVSISYLKCSRRPRAEPAGAACSALQLLILCQLPAPPSVAPSDWNSATRHCCSTSRASISGCRSGAYRQHSAPTRAVGKVPGMHMCSSLLEGSALAYRDLAKPRSRTICHAQCDLYITEGSRQDVY